MTYYIRVDDDTELSVKIDFDFKRLKDSIDWLFLDQIRLKDRAPDQHEIFEWFEDFLAHEVDVVLAED